MSNTNFGTEKKDFKAEQLDIAAYKKFKNDMDAIKAHFNMEKSVWMGLKRRRSPGEEKPHYGKYSNCGR